MGIDEILSKARGEQRNALLYNEAKELIENWGIPTAPWRMARNEQEALQAALSIGFPVVMKILSPDVIHKTDIGGVFTGLNREEELIHAYERIEGNSKKVKPAIRMQGVVIEKMLSGIEVIIGVTMDSQFGHVLMFGMGGIFVELLKDISFRLIPIEPADAQEMIYRVKGFPLLDGYRGKTGDIEGLKNLLLGVSQLVVQYPEIIEMDLNPVITSYNQTTVADIRVLTARG
ncbi:MAG TPA: acetate--CoA ligase family protein [Thermodesulfobacteriota bacterium]|nr:acetate--CoA ligase family protein [Thermodesulfobacteriota bacterium]